MARHHDGATGVGDFGGLGPILAAQQGRHQAGQKGVTGTQHVQHFHALTLVGGGVVNVGGNLALNHTAAQSAALHHQGGLAQSAHRLQAGNDVIGHTAGNKELFFGAHQQIEMGQHFLQLLGYMGVGHIAVFTRAPTGQAPQHRAVINVQHAHHAMLCGVVQRGLRGFAGGRGGEVRAGDGQGAALGNKGFVNQRSIHRHVGAVFAHEQQRKGVAVLQAQQHQGGQTLRVNLHLGGVAAFGLQGLGQKAAHLLVAHAGDHGAAQAQSGHAESQVARAATQVLGHAARIFQFGAELLRIQVNRQTPQAGQVVGATGRKIQGTHSAFSVSKGSIGNPAAGTAFDVRRLDTGVR